MGKVIWSNKTSEGEYIAAWCFKEKIYKNSILDGNSKIVAILNVDNGNEYYFYNEEVVGNDSVIFSNKGEYIAVWCPNVDWNNI